MVANTNLVDVDIDHTIHAYRRCDDVENTVKYTSAHMLAKRASTRQGSTAAQQRLALRTCHRDAQKDWRSAHQVARPW